MLNRSQRARFRSGDARGHGPVRQSVDRTIWECLTVSGGFGHTVRIRPTAISHAAILWQATEVCSDAVFHADHINHKRCLGEIARCDIKRFQSIFCARPPPNPRGTLSTIRYETSPVTKAASADESGSPVASPLFFRCGGIRRRRGSFRSLRGRCKRRPEAGGPLRWPPKIQ